MNIQIKLVLPLAMMGLAVFGVVFQGAAADIEPSSLPVSKARGFMGEWVLTVDAADGPMHLLLNFVDVDGKLGATLQSPAQTQAQIITDITPVSRGLKLRYAATFGETETGMVLVVRLELGTLNGSMSDELGLTTVEVRDSDELLGLGLFSADVRGVRGGKLPGRALMDLQGNQVKVHFVELKTGTDDHKRFGQVKNGEIFEFTSARATKFFTAADLKFGNIIIETENAGKNYPGVYSLWLRKVGDGWHLVFNHHADIWGTMHEAQADVAEIPLTVRTIEEEQKKFLIELEPREDEQGVLRLAWGNTEWTANFSLSQ